MVIFISEGFNKGKIDSACPRSCSGCSGGRNLQILGETKPLSAEVGQHTRLG